MNDGNGKYLILSGAKGNNLKNISVKFPLGKFISITGVSGGSGEDNGFSLWYDYNSIYGSSNGSRIPIGEGILIDVTFVNLDEIICLNEAYFSNVDMDFWDGNFVEVIKIIINIYREAMISYPFLNFYS